MSASLPNLRQGLLRLHKTLLDWERDRYERVHGRQSNTALLTAFLEDEQFAWLRPMSRLIVRIDELLEDQEPPAADDVTAIIAQLKLLTSPSQTGNDYAQRYYAALQESAESVFAHRDLVAQLTSDS
ncbi:MAG TPA: hypothetical protein VM818_24200 [Vicinamibacterales bacterium]|jgi:hypothetical protein|nr:hypothetical protein [Vicinamibacterales bacterium]